MFIPNSLEAEEKKYNQVVVILCPIRVPVIEQEGTTSYTITLRKIISDMLKYWILGFGIFTSDLKSMDKTC